MFVPITSADEGLAKRPDHSNHKLPLRHSRSRPIPAVKFVFDSTVSSDTVGNNVIHDHMAPSDAVSRQNGFTLIDNVQDRTHHDRDTAGICDNVFLHRDGPKGSHYTSFTCADTPTLDVNVATNLRSIATFKFSTPTPFR